ncbi:MAG: hypothetical protein GDA49_09580 [Rhodospirillales bacterium]|nr:hypothetical protein [Rhodospirillales bacterium]
MLIARFAAYAAAWTVAAVTLSACDTANQNSIFRTTSSSDEQVILLDAKQRAVLTQTVKEKVSDNTYRRDIVRACAEPSPDVFSVLSTAFSASAELGDDRSAELANAINEAGSNIGLRTQTIQVLRDMM